MCKQVPGPVCFNLKFSSLNVFPYIDFPPVPLWWVKSPPCNKKTPRIRQTGKALPPSQPYLDCKLT